MQFQIDTDLMALKSTNFYYAGPILANRYFNVNEGRSSCHLKLKIGLFAIESWTPIIGPPIYLPEGIMSQFHNRFPYKQAGFLFQTCEQGPISREEVQGVPSRAFAFLCSYKGLSERSCCIPDIL